MLPTRWFSTDQVPSKTESRVLRALSRTERFASIRLVSLQSLCWLFDLPVMQCLVRDDVGDRPKSQTCGYAKVKKERETDRLASLSKDAKLVLTKERQT